MASTDFAQFRLQQIRSIENQHVIEKSNIELKKQIEVLRATNSKPIPEDYKPRLAAFARSVKTWLRNMNVEMDQTKSLCVMQTEQISFLNKTIQETVQMMADQARIHTADSNQLTSENAGLMNALRKARQEADDCREAKRVAEAKNNKLSASLDEAHHSKNLLTQSYELLQEQVSGMSTRMEEMTTQHETAKVEIIRLKQKIKKLEEYGGEALAAALREQQMVTYQNEQLIAELRAKNEDQELVITNLRLHIERLTAAMNGNKSHFAKFVELKNENAVLHTELSRTKGAPVSVLREQQSQHVAQQQGQEAIEKMLTTPNIPRGAIGAVDPSLVDYHASINSYISEVRQKAPGGTKGKTSRPPPGGLKPYGKAKDKDKDKDKMMGVTIGVSGINSARNDPGVSNPSPRASVDDSYASVSGSGKGGLFPRVAVLSSSSTQNSRKPSPIVKGTSGGNAFGPHQESTISAPTGFTEIAPNFQNSAMPTEMLETVGPEAVAPFKNFIGKASTKNRSNSRMTVV